MRNRSYGYLEASIGGAACSLAVDALVAATALAMNDWEDGLSCPPIQCLTLGNKSPQSSKGFPQSPGTKRQKGNEQKKTDYVQDHGTSVGSTDQSCRA